MPVKKVNAMVYAQLSKEAKKLYKMDDSVSGKQSVKTVTESRLYQSKKRRSSSSSARRSPSVSVVQPRYSPPESAVRPVTDAKKTIETFVDGGYNDLMREKLDVYSKENGLPSSVILGGAVLLVALLMK